MIIDVHGHLGNINIAPFWQADEKKLEEHLNKAGIDYLCVSSAKSLMYDVQEGNADVAKALENSDKLLGYVTVNPMFPETIKELRYLENSKFVGVKVHPDYHGYHVSSPHAWDFLHQVAEQTSLMLFHVSCMPGTGFADAEDIARFGSEHPATNIIMAHMAGIFQNGIYPYFPNFRGLEKVSKYTAYSNNIYIDTAHQLMYVYPGVMEKMIELVGVDHIVFGTDCPLQGGMQMKFAIDIIEELQIPIEDKEKIFSGNALKIIEKIKIIV